MGTGIGTGKGGAREGAGRPKGIAGINHKARELLAAAERDDLLTPLGFLLDVMRDPRQALHDRMMAANICMPYLHPRLSAVRLTAAHEEMTDEQLLSQVAQLEEIVAALPPKPPPDNPAPEPLGEYQPPLVLPLRRSGDQPAPEPAGRRLRYDPVGKRMVQVTQ